MQFSPEQLRVIKSRGKNLLVSAAAGSGKTTVLVERVLGLIEEGVNIDEILIVTFTRAASADMRRKLEEKLRARAESGDRQTCARFNEQCERLEFASISTLHSFCTRLIRRFFEKADVDPDFRILDDTENALLMRDALDDVMEEAFGAPDEGLKILCTLRRPGEVCALVEAMYGFVSAQPFPDEWYERTLTLFETDGGTWFDILLSAARAKLEGARLWCSQALEIAKSADGPANYVPALEQDLDRLESTDALSYDDLRAFAAAYKNTEPPRAKKGGGGDPEKREEIKKLREKVSKTLKDVIYKSLLSLDRQETLEDVRADAPAVKTLYRLARELENRLTEVKRERAALTFDDLEHLSIKLLEDEEVRTRVHGEYKYVFVDEYQDTSDIQEAIVSAVAGDDNRFMVGDIKQSIYRFRDAEPQLFLEKYAAYRQGGNNELIVLGTNYRSRAGVIDFVNLLFERVMNGGASEIVYDEDAKLHMGRKADGADAPTELIIIDRAGTAGEDMQGDVFEEAREDDAGTSDEDAEELENSEREAVVIARRIRELMDDDKTLALRDICVITRTGRNVLQPMAAMLASQGIPAYAEGSESYYEAYEVAVVISALKLLVSRANEIELLAVLRSPMFGVSTQELAEIRVMSEGVSWWEAVENVRDKYPQLERFLTLRNKWKLMAGSIALNRLIRLIYDDTGFYTFAGALPDGKHRMGNLDVLCQTALNFEHARGSSLSEFLEYTEEMKTRGDGSAAHELGENDDVVRLMTAHKSKGLEFRVVFAAMLGRSFSSKPPNDTAETRFFADKHLGAAVMHMDERLCSTRETAVMRAIRVNDSVRELAEDLRVLYVTLTRAQDRLILIGSVKDFSKAAVDWAASRDRPNLYKSALDVAAAAALGCPGSECLGCAAEEGKPAVLTRIINAADISAETQKQENSVVGRMDELLASDVYDPETERVINWKYPYKAMPYAPLKLAVTGLGRDFTGGNIVPEVKEAPDFISGRDPKKYTARGTAIHASLRYLDYEPFRRMSAYTEMTVEAARQLDLMAAKRLIDEEERRLVSPALIADFIMSPVAKRALAADVCRREWSFSLRMPISRVCPEYTEGSILVQGTIDLCFIENGEWILADYKTERSADEQELIKRYKPQLDIYAEALSELTGRPVRQAVICLVSQKKEIYLTPGRWEKENA